MLWFNRNPRSRPRRHPRLKPSRKPLRRLPGAQMVSSVAATRSDGSVVTIAVIDPWLRCFDRPGYVIGLREPSGEMRFHVDALSVIPIEQAYRVMVLLRSVLSRSEANGDPWRLLKECRVLVELGVTEVKLPPDTDALMRRLSHLLGEYRLHRLLTKPVNGMPSWVRERIEAERPL